MKTTRHLLAGVFLISMGALALEVVLTRIFSVTMWYHFAFLAISMALMGSAMAGVFLYFFPRLTQPDTAQMWIGRASVALAVAVPIVFLIYLRIPFRPVLMNRDGAFSAEQIGWLALIYLLLTIPFFLSGSVLALTLAGWPNDAGKIYAADLIGAALGCLLSVAALARLGGVNALFLLSLVLALAATAFIYGRRRWAIPAGLAILLTGGLLVSNLAAPWLRIVVNKAGGDEPPIVYEKWNIHSRVTVYEPDVFPFFWGISPAKWEETIAAGGKWDHALLLIDAVAGTPIQSFNGDLSTMQFLRNDLTAIAYHLIDDPETLVIGPGGGRDVLSALASGAPHVTAVEVNPAVIEAVRGPFADFAGHLYDRPDVTAVVADARGYVERSPGDYDVIQASLIDTWAAGGSGAFALSENSLYTKEAFTSYFNHLSDDGLLSISRWYLPDRPAETLRLVTTGLAGWEAAGVGQVHRQQLAGDDGRNGRQPFGHGRGQAQGHAGRRQHLGRVADGDDLGLPPAHSVGELGHLGRHDSGRGDDHHREAGLDHRQRAMQEVGAAVRFDDGVGHLLQLERRLEGRGVVVAPPGDHAARHVAVARRGGGDGVVHAQRRRHRVGHGGQRLPLFGRVAEGGADQGDGRQFGGVGLGGGHGPLLAGLQVDDHVPLIGQGGGGAIGQHGRQRALPPRLGQHAHDVGALAALADAQHQRVAEARRAMVDGEQTGRGQPHRQAVHRPQHVLGIAAGVVAGAAGGDDDVVDGPAVDEIGQGGGRGFFLVQQAAQDSGLLVDFAVEVGVGELGHSS